MLDSQQDVGTPGYGKLARFLGYHPRMMVFRNFSTLGMKCLLYRQAELSHLEKDLESIAQRDSQSEDPEKRNFEKNWFDMQRAKKGEDWQIQKVKEVDKALKEYYEWMLLIKQIHELEPPSITDLSSLLDWLVRSDCGNNFLKGAYAEGEAWDKPDLASLCVKGVKEDQQMDSFTKWIYDCLPKFHQFLGRRIKTPIPADEESGTGEVYRYSRETIARTISMVSTMLAALCPVAAFFVLSLANHPILKLVLAILLTLFFAWTVSIITNPTRAQMFAATTAYAAILVATGSFSKGN